jgi:DNA-binding Lrp family transcriptional regulator
MKYEVQHYKEDKPLVEAMLAMMAAHAIERLGASNYAPDTAKILGLWKMEVLRLILMRNDDGKIVGYQGWLCTNQLTNMSTKQAILSYIYIDKDNRNIAGQLGEFLKYGIDAMRILGAADILLNVDGDQMWLKDKFAEAGFGTVRAMQLSYSGVQ